MNDKPNKGTVPVASSPENAALGARFKAVRRQQKVWLRPLAEAMGCSVNTIRWHEAGDRMMRLDEVMKAASIMGVDPAELVKQEGGAA
jgi:transcriptional regulator with XRE-family HTH domain